MLYQRVITAVVLLIIIIGALWISPLAFTAVAAIAVGCCFAEWLKICRCNSALSWVIGAVFAAFIFWIEYAQPAFFMGLQSGNELMLITGLATVIWTVLTAIIFTKRQGGWNVSPLLGFIMALLIVPAAWFSLMYLYRTGGAVYMISVLALVWIADVTAYFGGMTFHGPKMAVGISPKKTWSGAITAFVCTICAAFVVYYFSPEAPLWTNVVIKQAGVFAAGLLFFVVVLFSIAGDLFESALKRSAGVKDSSNLLPGHGGFYDRLDAQMSVLPLCVFIVLFLQGF